MKDHGVADVILGIRIHRTPQGLALSQSHYIEKVLDKFKYMEFDIAKTPLDANFALRKNEGESDSQLEYARVLGCLMYIMNCTRPDIACTISKLSRYTSNPNKTHWMAMKRVLGYLKYTQDYALHYNKYPTVLEGYSDANWITGSNEVKSTSGYAFTIGGGEVSWKSSKQTCIAHSTIESEFIALDKAGEEVEWLRNFLEDIPYWPKPVAPVCIHCDSQAAIGRVGSMMYNGKSRYIRRRHNTVRELLSSGIITIDYVNSKDNVSDPLTKGLSREGVERTSKGMGLRRMTSRHGGSENDLTTIIHIAASEGDINMIKNLLNHYLDCWDTLNSNNQNALHVAVLNNQDKVVRFLLDSDKCDSLVDEPDSYGNTPLHLFATSGNHVPELINHPREKKMSFNKENQNPT
ncbi:hypothetical protein CQW23_12989 [Capsicum baccatum]|uniref:Uncharacterized protein n=1 Tax=Capsicum baccatum TaxID=33114 RepID=A0A2G2WUB0_CAPBA|nr:hypothetical protein CQW23_12989 [Capsicum baccatum]